MTWLASDRTTGVHQYEVGMSASVVDWTTSDGRSLRASLKFRCLPQ